MKLVQKIINRNDGTKVPFQYMEPESLAEALKTLGEKKIIQAIRYTLSVVERKKALATPPLPKGLRKLLRLHPEKMEEIMKNVMEEPT